MGILGNVLSHVGDYLVKQGEYDEQRARDDLLFRRELALKQVEAQYANANSERDHQERLAEIAETGKQNRLTGVTEAVAKSKLAEEDDTRDLKKQIYLEDLKDTHARRLKDIEHKYNIGEDEAKQRLANELSGGKITKWATTSDGRMVGYDQYGHTVAQSSTPGTFNPPNSGGEDDSLDGLIDDTPAPKPSGQARTQSAASPSATASKQYQPGDTVRNKAGQVLQLGQDGKWKPYVGIAP